MDSNADKSQKTVVGALVDAKYDGNFFPGKIDGVNADGTFSVLFDDGDRLESAKAPDILLKKLPPGALGIVVVEAKYDGEWYRGIVKKTNSDGSFHVVFEDGDENEETPPSDVRLVHGVASQSDEQGDSYDDNDDNYSDDVEDAEDEEKPKGTKEIQIQGFTPGNNCQLQSKLDMLASNQEAYLNAPPEDRFAVLQFQMVVLEQQLWQQNLAGEDWFPAAVGGLDSEPMLSEEKGPHALILEMRRRAVALVRLCHGDASLEMVQAIVDLAGCYECSKLWDQVSFHLNRASQLMMKLTGGLEDNKDKATLEQRSRVESNHSKEDSEYILELFQELRTRMNREGRVKAKDIEKSMKRPLPKDKTDFEWAWLVSFLRKQKWFKATVQNMLNSVRKDYLSIVRLAFKPLDSHCKDVVQMNEGEKLVGELKRQVRFMDMPGSQDMLTTIEEWSEDKAREVPITWEEILALIISSSDKDPTEIWICDLRASIMMLSAQMQKYQGRLDSSLENAKKALRELERLDRLGTQMSVELYILASEVLVLQQQTWSKHGPDRRRAKAEAWLASDEGDRIWRREVRRLFEGSKHGGQRMSKLEVEYRAREALITARMARLKEKEKPGARSAPEVKRLDQALDLLEKAKTMQKNSLGEDHVHCTRCSLALARFFITHGEREKACEELQSALEKLEAKIDGFAPVLVSINFHLGRIHISQGANTKQDGIDCIMKAVDLQYNHFAKIKEQFMSSKTQEQYIPGVAYNEASRLFLSFGERTSKMLKEATKILSEIGEDVFALDCANKSVVVAEAMYGNDSLITAKLLKLLGERYRKQEMYSQSRLAFSKCYRIHVLHYGRKDEKVQKLQVLVKQVDKQNAKRVNQDFLDNDDELSDDLSF